MIKMMQWTATPILLSITYMPDSDVTIRNQYILKHICDLDNMTEKHARVIYIAKYREQEDVQFQMNCARSFGHFRLIYLSYKMTFIYFKIRLHKNGSNVKQKLTVKLKKNLQTRFIKSLNDRMIISRLCFFVCFTFLYIQLGLFNFTYLFTII